MLSFSPSVSRVTAKVISRLDFIETCCYNWADKLEEISAVGLSSPRYGFHHGTGGEGYEIY